MNKFELERRRLGLTQRELAEKIGMSRVEICNIEHGKVIPRPSTCKKLADLFGTDVSELFGWKAD
jgi:DNA-binding XRE family transcriptional regulator